MKEILATVKNFIQESSPAQYSIILAFPIVLLVLGYLIWAAYLYNFGFVEHELLRSEFILTGLTFVIFSLLTVLLAGWLLNKIFVIALRTYDRRADSTEINKRAKLVYQFFIPNSSVGRIAWGVILFFAAISIYTLEVFPVIPAFMGGGEPRSIALIATVDNVKILSSFGISQPVGGINQTQNLCVVHEDSSSVYILMPDRVLMFDKSILAGIVALPGMRAVNEQDCINAAFVWSHQEFDAQLKLQQVLVYNTLRSLVHLPPVHLQASASCLPATPSW